VPQRLRGGPGEVQQLPSDRSDSDWVDADQPDLSRPTTRSKYGSIEGRRSVLRLDNDPIVRSRGDGDDAGFQRESRAMLHCGGGERVGEVRNANEAVTWDEEPAFRAGRGQRFELE
jgi:hypothetical protein